MALAFIPIPIAAPSVPAAEFAALKAKYDELTKTRKEAREKREKEKANKKSDMDTNALEIESEEEGWLFGPGERVG